MSELVESVQGYFNKQNIRTRAETEGDRILVYAINWYGKKTGLVCAVKDSTVYAKPIHFDGLAAVLNGVKVIKTLAPSASR